MKLSIRNLSFSYREDKAVLENVNFEINSGDVLAVLGPNGAGKTTLQKCILGFLAPSEGICELDGKNVRQYFTKEFFEKVSYVPQMKENISALPVRDLIALGLAGRVGTFSEPSLEDYRKVEETARKLEIEKLMDRKSSELSGGELQMVLIARALISEPELLIMDEPGTGLDMSNQMTIIETIRNIAKQGMSCIFNTHDPMTVMACSNKALILGKDGSYVYGNSRDIMNRQTVEKFFGIRAVRAETEFEGKTYRALIPIERVEKEGKTK